MDFSNLKTFLDNYTAAMNTAGCAVSVYVGGKCVFEHAAGYADLETKERYSTEHFLNIYSCSKLATVIAACQLMERGLIVINDPLYDYIPEYKNMTVREADGTLREAKKSILIGDLFSMTAGLDYNLESGAFERAREKTQGRCDTQTLVRELAKEPLSFDPGERWQYSLCHDVLAGLVEVVSGMRFSDYVKKNIFEPLGMTSSFYHPNEATMANMASQYSFVPHGASTDFDVVEAQKYGKARGGTLVKVGVENTRFVPGPEYDSGGAGIISTTEDYAKLASALAGGGKGAGGERILSPYTVELIKTDRLTEKQRADFNLPALRGYGYGLGVRTHISRAQSGSPASLGEFGWSGAAGSLVIADTEAKLGVFFTQHCLNPRSPLYQPRVKNTVYSCMK